MWWYYDGVVELDDNSEIEVKSEYTLEEALEVYADWPSGAPKYHEQLHVTKREKSKFEPLKR